MESKWRKPMTPITRWTQRPREYAAEGWRPFWDSPDYCAAIAQVDRQGYADTSDVGYWIRCANRLWFETDLCVKHRKEEVGYSGQEVRRNAWKQYGLDARTATHLADVGLTSLDQLARITDDELLAIKGMGTTGLADVRRRVPHDPNARVQSAKGPPVMPKPRRLRFEVATMDTGGAKYFMTVIGETVGYDQNSQSFNITDAGRVIFVVPAGSLYYIKGEDYDDNPEKATDPESGGVGYPRVTTAAAAGLSLDLSPGD